MYAAVTARQRSVRMRRLGSDIDLSLRASGANAAIGGRPHRRRRPSPLFHVKHVSDGRLFVCWAQRNGASAAAGGTPSPRLPIRSRLRAGPAAVSVADVESGSLCSAGVLGAAPRSGAHTADLVARPLRGVRSLPVEASATCTARGGRVVAGLPAVGALTEVAKRLDAGGTDPAGSPSSLGPSTWSTSPAVRRARRTRTSRRPPRRRRPRSRAGPVTGVATRRSRGSPVRRRPAVPGHIAERITNLGWMPTWNCLRRAGHGGWWAAPPWAPPSSVTRRPSPEYR